MRNKKRLSSLTCLVCGAPAIGFNFSVITCMCCKAFFRRNALFGLGAYQCRYSTGNCTINILTRRDCSYCRLRKCFQMGMKKELILSEDIKRLKREKIQANKQLTLNSLKQNHTSLLTDLSNAYEFYCRIPIMNYEKREYELTCHQPVKFRIKFQHYLESYQAHRQAIEGFFRQIPELQTFSSEEQNFLFKQNIRYLLKINSIETIDDSFPIWGSIHLLLQGIYGKVLLEQIDTFLHQFKSHLNDSKSIQLLLIILLLSTSINYSGHLNTLTLYNIQEKYTSLLWIYLTERYGEENAQEKMSLIIRYCLRLQIIEHLFETKRTDCQWEEVFLAME